MFLGFDLPAESTSQQNQEFHSITSLAHSSIPPFNKMIKIKATKERKSTRKQSNKNIFVTNFWWCKHEKISRNLALITKLAFNLWPRERKTVHKKYALFFMNLQEFIASIVYVNKVIKWSAHLQVHFDCEALKEIESAMCIALSKYWRWNFSWSV